MDFFFDVLDDRHTMFYYAEQKAICIDTKSILNH